MVPSQGVRRGHPVAALAVARDDQQAQLVEARVLLHLVHPVLDQGGRHHQQGGGGQEHLLAQLRRAYKSMGLITLLLTLPTIIISMAANYFSYQLILHS